MRPPTPSETPCANSAQCECKIIGSNFQRNDDDCTPGFIGVAFFNDSLCILCLRCKITQTYFHNLTLGLSTKEPIHSHYNAIGHGEYNAESCLWPNGANGITDPVVFHSRSNYYYSGNAANHTLKLKQHSHVNFRQASSSIKSHWIYILVLLSRHLQMFNIFFLKNAARSLPHTRFWKQSPPFTTNAMATKTHSGSRSWHLYSISRHIFHMFLIPKTQIMKMLLSLLNSSSWAC
jgi:hypothetical protein